LELETVIEVAQKKEAVNLVKEGGRSGRVVVLVLNRGGGKGGGREGQGLLLLLVGLKVVPKEVLKLGHDAVDVCVAVFDSMGMGREMGIDKEEGSVGTHAEQGGLSSFVVNDVPHTTRNFAHM